VDSPDIQAFLDVLPAHRDLFSAEEISIARAPGRLDLMGGIADYSGSLVLQLPLASAACAAAQWSDDQRVHIRTTDPAAGHGAANVGLPLDNLLGGYEQARAALAGAKKHWAAYIAGAITVLNRERGVTFPHGVRWLIKSDVPAGKGVSSSAAIEVAAMQALCGLAGLELRLTGREIALLCQKVENLVAGAPCGVMDQMTAACGEANALLALLCQPAELQPPVVLPDGVEVFGIDSGIRHAVSGADYGSVRVGAFMGYRVIASLAGLQVSREDGRTIVTDPQWRGYLANISPEAWESRFSAHVPERLTGAAFLSTFGGHTDTVTSIDPARTYAIRQPTTHPIHEHARVTRFRALLQQSADDRTLGELGALMYESHASYSACGLGSSGTDDLVALVREAGPSRGLFGAKITGGGSGGTVAVLARAGSRSAVDDVAARYARSTGRVATVIAGSSNGAIRSGSMMTWIPARRV